MSGYSVGRPASAYALYNTVFILTRLFTMTMLPSLGMIVDTGMTLRSYYIGCIISIALATASSCFIYLRLDIYASRFSRILNSQYSGVRLIYQIIGSIFSFGVSDANIPVLNPSSAIRMKIFWVSAFVHFIYSSSILFMFSLALAIPEYRTSLSHLSGFINAFGAVLLTFWIEPKISYAVDQGVDGGADGARLIKAVLLGRIFGISVISSAFFSLQLFIYS
nr:DUF2837 family protein [Sphingobium sp. YBL2]